MCFDVISHHLNERRKLCVLDYSMQNSFRCSVLAIQSWCTLIAFIRHCIFVILAQYSYASLFCSIMASNYFCSDYHTYFKLCVTELLRNGFGITLGSISGFKQ